MRNISDKCCPENKNSHFIRVTFSRKSCRLWSDVEGYDRARRAIYCT